MEMMTEDLSRPELFIGGRWRAPAGGGGSLEVINPATEQRIATTPDAAAADVDAAVVAARTAFEDPSGWRALPVARRAELLDAFATELAEREEALAHLAAVETGRPISSHRGRPSRPAELVRYFAGLARVTAEEELRPMPEPRAAGGVRSTVRRVPIGVTAAIVPYNAPVLLAMQKVGPALALGGTIVVKSPPQAPLDMYLVAEAAQAAGLPDGVLNVVAGGREAGVALVAHPGIDKVAFTGSTAAGRAIGEECGRALKPVTLELGGKSAAIVLDDADLGAVCRGLAFVAFAYAGQNCFTNSRLLAPRSRYEETVEAVSAFAAAIGVGDPLDPEVRMGPLISHDHRERVKALIASGIAEGARVTTGGRAPGHLPRGWYLEPTVFRDADNRMRICREEIFGPVLAIIPYDTDEQAIAIANDSDFGLAGSVWSSDAGRASSVARRIEAGTVGVNGFGFNSAAPFGGWKDSGVGTELGPEGLAAYALTQTIHLPA